MHLLPIDLYLPPKVVSTPGSTSIRVVILDGGSWQDISIHRDFTSWGKVGFFHFRHAMYSLRLKPLNHLPIPVVEIYGGAQIRVARHVEQFTR